MAEKKDKKQVRKRKKAAEGKAKPSASQRSLPASPPSPPSSRRLLLRGISDDDTIVSLSALVHPAQVLAVRISTDKDHKEARMTFSDQREADRAFSKLRAAKRPIKVVWEK